VEIEHTALYREVEAIVGDVVKPVHFSWRADIHVNGVTYTPLKLLSIDTVQDFESNYADEVLVTLAVSGGTYAKRIYPFQDKIDITLYRTPLREVADTTDEEQSPSYERYSATLLENGNPLIEANSHNSPSEEAMNLTNIFEVTFQLVGKGLEQLRMKSVGRIFRNTDVESVIKTLMTNDSKAIKVDGVNLPQGVTMVEASNKAIRPFVEIRHGTKLVDVPQYVHHKCGGVYSAGMGYYLYRNFWHIYPCYDTTRFNKALKTMTLINLPSNKMPGIERTYRSNGRNLVVLATGEVRLKDDSEGMQLNAGNGVRFATTKGMMEGTFVKTKGNKTSGQRGVSTSEYVASERRNGQNNVHISQDAITANPYIEHSKLARRQGALMTFVWENSQPDLIAPGMMIKVLYVEEGDVKEVYGTLLKAHHYTQLRGQGMQASRYISQSALAVFIKLIRE